MDMLMVRLLVFSKVDKSKKIDERNADFSVPPASPLARHPFFLPFTFWEQIPLIELH